MLISYNLHGGNFWNFSHIFLNKCTARSYGYICPNMVLVLEMAILEHFWWEHSQRTLGVHPLRSIGDTRYVGVYVALG